MLTQIKNQMEVLSGELWFPLGAAARPTCQLHGAGAVGRRPPRVPVLADLLNPAGVEALVRPAHVGNPQPVHLPLRLLNQAELRLGEAAGVVAVQLQPLDAQLCDEELGGLHGDGRGGWRRRR